MKKILFLFLIVPGIASAGTITTAFNPLGTITFSSASITSIPITIDSQTFSPSFTGGSSPLTWNMTIGSGSNRFVAIGCQNAFSTISGITLNGSALTLQHTQTSPSGDPETTTMWSMVAPPSGSQSIVVSFSGSSNNGCSCSATSFTGVNQSAPVDISSGAYNTPGSGTNTVTFTTTVKNDMLMDSIVDRQGSTNDIPGSGQTGFNLFSGLGVMSGGISTKSATTAGSYSMTWTGTNSGGGNQVCQSAIAIVPANP